MTYNVFSGTLNPTQSISYLMSIAITALVTIHQLTLVTNDLQEEEKSARMARELICPLYDAFS